ncbi:hypothetical protein [Oceanobacillus rekensis]|uniref:hypothetical protein n=1 Tax=Oceanobacillus rekensis TaxID=937927 RepID=UPI000B445D8B|nr:hypothetical protein [Oceanobacillus rekensis]
MFLKEEFLLGNYIDWVRKNKLFTFLIIVTAFLLPIVIVQVLFKLPAKLHFFQAEFSAGDIISYSATFLTFLSTSFLGILALYQNDKLGKTNSKLSKINNELVRHQTKPLLTVNASLNEYEGLKCFYRSVERNDKGLLINNGYSTKPTYAPYQRLSFINIGMGAAAKVELYWYELTSVEGLEDLNNIDKRDIENFYEKVNYSNFQYVEDGELKNGDWLISPQIDLGVSEETNKMNLVFSYEKNVGSLHAIVEIRYEDLMGEKYKRLLYIGYLNSNPITLPVSEI